ncbi:MFS transporter [Prosthecobacter fluviatilis]|uniref:MFS transporter n=1 Tax=Prosthecobacter fluviatilis TaxID=445931 RepID=A0ABW0KJE4_9BACT
MNRDLTLLFLSRATRLHAFGMTSVILALHLARRGLSTGDVGLLFTLALLTDAALTLVLSTHADRWGRRRTLMLSGFLMALAGMMLVVGESWWVVLLGITIGVISPGGNEVGPFLAIEQACLAQCTTAQRRTQLIAWYNVTGFVATAVGALSAGAWLKTAGSQGGASHVLWAYALSGVAVMVLAMLLTHQVETAPGQNTQRAKSHWTGLQESRSKVVRLGGLFALDSFAGGFIPQSLLAYWFATRWSLSEWELGQVFFATSLLSGISGLVAAPLSQKIGMVNTMVFTHLPSNVLLMLVPVMPSAGLAIGCLLLRHTLSQMDVPVRQSYVMSLVRPEERSAANGILATVRSLSAALSPALAGGLLSPTAWLSGPLLIAGGLKSLYDVLLFKTFRSVPTEESC